eukprot:TRINITY_DN6360_c3_g1_i1.p1 TRINITY_DN6360_c3_g1~~TRINITY_DN6360_c3_g1_i1.p1  ORF type:complete len:563 (-),score=95.93 TRINITY_DN6360_c3_g1_i1:43-1731(-)
MEHVTLEEVRPCSSAQPPLRATRQSSAVAAETPAGVASSEATIAVETCGYADRLRGDVGTQPFKRLRTELACGQRLAVASSAELSSSTVHQIPLGIPTPGPLALCPKRRSRPSRSRAAVYARALASIELRLRSLPKDDRDVEILQLPRVVKAALVEYMGARKRHDAVSATDRSSAEADPALPAAAQTKSTCHLLAESDCAAECRRSVQEQGSTLCSTKLCRSEANEERCLGAAVRRKLPAARGLDAAAKATKRGNAAAEQLRRDGVRMVPPGLFQATICFQQLLVRTRTCKTREAALQYRKALQAVKAAVRGENLGAPGGGEKLAASLAAADSNLCGAGVEEMRPSFCVYLCTGSKFLGKVETPTTTSVAQALRWRKQLLQAVVSESLPAFRECWLAILQEARPGASLPLSLPAAQRKVDAHRRRHEEREAATPAGGTASAAAAAPVAALAKSRRLHRVCRCRRGDRRGGGKSPTTGMTRSRRRSIGSDCDLRRSARKVKDHNQIARAARQLSAILETHAHGCRRRVGPTTSCVDSCAPVTSAASSVNFSRQQCRRLSGVQQ